MKLQSLTTKTYGGTNWGNLGYALGYTSYDYGAAISEDRTTTREKYSEAKLEANFLMASPAYQTATPMNGTNGTFASTDLIAVTPVVGKPTAFYIIRHAAYNSLNSTKYRLTVPTSKGNITIPQLSQALTLNGRDSKVSVTDYELAANTLLYSTSDLFTWQSYSPKTVLILYGRPNETHEAAFLDCNSGKLLEGSGVQFYNQDGYLIVNWDVTPTRKVVQIGGNLFVYLLGLSLTK